MNKIGLRKINKADAPFLLALVNTEAWIKFIGDRNVHSVAEAEAYIENRILKPFEQYGFGMYLCYLIDTNEAFGLCGLVQRDYLDYPDLGFALLPKYEGKGLMKEACEIILKDCSTDLFAICTPDNHKSISLLERLNFKLENEEFIPPNEKEILLLLRRKQSS